MPIDLRPFTNGNIPPLVVITSSDGSKPITGFCATGHDSKSVKRFAREVKKKIRENPELLTGGAAPDSDEDEDVSDDQDDLSSSYNLLAQTQKWTNSSGKDITAAVLSVGVSSVTFVMPDGKQVDYPLSKLSEASRDALLQLSE